MAKFVSINRLERCARIEEAIVDAELEDSWHGRRWRIRQSGENQRPFYLPDQLFHELFAPAEQSAYRQFSPGGVYSPN